MVNFKNLNKGDTFLYKNEVYVKIGSKSALLIDLQKICHFGKKTQVEILKEV